jgi:uncharacterized delta-60 repeat protein
MRSSKAAFLAAVVLCFTPAALAQAGSLDATFGNKGIVALSGPVQQTNAVAIQPDGKIVVAAAGIVGTESAAVLARLNTDGTLDTSFGSGGYVTFSNSFGVGSFFALALQPDRKIVAAEAGSLQVVRVPPNGTFDQSFGAAGATPPIQNVVCTGGSLVLQSNGKILVAYIGGGVPGGIVRFTSAGQLDASFGNKGFAALTQQNPNGPVLRMALTSDGHILVANLLQVSFQPIFYPYFPDPYVNDPPGWLVRYNSNGAVDTTFGANGYVPTFPSEAMVQQTNSGILFAGGITSSLTSLPTEFPNPIGFGISRYTASGALDTTFGAGGATVTSLGQESPYSAALAVTVQANGEIITGGFAGSMGSNPYAPPPFSIALARYTSSGALDHTFGANGVVITPITNASYDWISGLAIQSDGKILAIANLGTVNRERASVAGGLALRYLAE